MITELAIENAVVSLSDENINTIGLFERILQGQDDLYYYLFLDDMSMLLSNESELYHFLIGVILYASQGKIKSEVIRRDSIIRLEEKNWKILEDVGFTRDIRDRFTPFFEDSKEEDLLAFVEDLLSDTEEYQLTDPGRNIIMVKCKTLIDLIEQPGK